MSTFSNTAREVEMPNGDIVKLHDAVTPNSTSNIKKFKYDDNGHVTESEAANATDLNLNSYATPTSGTTAIGTSDNVQTAIGKLDHQSQIDKTNILLVKEYTRRNVLSITDRSFTAGTNNRSAVCEIPPLRGKVVVYFGSLTSTDTDSSACAVGFSDANGTTITTNSIDRGNDVSVTLDLVDSVATSMFIYPGNSWTQSAGDSLEYKNGMVIEKELYDHDPTYTGYSAPNSDLTYLEAEDRAALAEVVDSGAKNQLILTGTDYNPNSVNVYWDYANGSVRVTGSSPTTSVVYIYLGNWNAPQTGSYYLIADGITSSANILVYDDGNWATYNIPGQSKSALATWTKGTSRNIYLRIESGVTVGDITVRPMICTKAAFDISQKFVPYFYPSKVLYNQYKRIQTNTTLSATGLEFVAPTNGVYKFTALTAMSNTVPDILAIYHVPNANATPYLLTQITQPTGSNISLVLSGIVYCAAGGSIALYSKYNSSAQNTHGLVIEKVSDLAEF